MLVSRIKFWIMGIAAALLSLGGMYLYGVHMGNLKCNVGVLKEELKDAEKSEGIDRAVDRMGSDTLTRNLMYWVRED